MRAGASTPEELESLLEDAFVIGDPAALAGLFDDAGVLAVGHADVEMRDREEIARLAASICERGFTYLANPIRVLQTHETALIVTDGAVNVTRRGGDGRWRYAISLLHIDDTTRRENR
jgi:hypothetical protein